MSRTLPQGIPKRLAHDPADDVGDLGGGDHDDPPRLHVGEADVVFNVAVLDGGGVVPALHLDEARLLDGLLDSRPCGCRVWARILPGNSS